MKLAQEGTDVAVTARTSSEIEKVVSEIQTIGRKAMAIPCDVTKNEEISQMVQKVMGRFGKVDILVNNAGRGGGGRTADLEDQLWHDIINTNLNSVYLVTKEVLNRGKMLKQRQGRIVNIASTGGKQGVIYAAAYTASKHGIIGFTKSLALELASQGITVNAVCPGFVETDLSKKARSNYARIWGVTPEDALKRIEARIPIGRYILPEEVAPMVAYLASGDAQCITGQAINICGGLGNY